MKKKYLLIYNYDTGGGFAYIYARSKEEIYSIFPKPKFNVIDPESESEPIRSDKNETLITDIDNLGGWLKKAKDNRDKSGYW